jgi:very-short-patch-repair endonuclease
VTVIDHIRVSTVARTLVDLAEILDESALEKAIQQSEMRGLLDIRSVIEVIERGNGRKRAHILRDLLDDTSPPTMNEIEQRFFALCEQAGLPLPKTQVPVGPYVVDFLWPEQRVVVETDGAKVHRTHRAFEHDKVKAADLAVFGLTYVPVTWRRLTRKPREIEETIRAVLQAAA